MKFWWIPLALAGLVASCFDVDETRGLPCTSDDHCAGKIECEMGFCGGPSAAEGQNCSSEADCPGSLTCVAGMCEDGIGGDPCELGQNVCLDSTTLGVCEAGTTVARTCDEICMEAGYYEGNLCASSGQGGKVCYCDESTGPCTNEPGTCTENGNLELCSSGNKQVIDCDEHCWERGEVKQYCDSALIQEFSMEGCVCGTGVCAEGERFCTSDSSMMECVGGEWLEFGCFESGVCGDGQDPLGCNYIAGLDVFSCACSAAPA